MLLVLSHSGDGTWHLVKSKLDVQGIPYRFFDINTFPQTLCISRSVICGTDEAFHSNHASMADITVVWNRRIKATAVDPILTDRTAREWAEAETEFGFQSLLSTLHAVWINAPHANEALRYNKLLQVIIAREVGVRVPATILSNDLEELQNFAGKFQYQVVMKKIRMGMLVKEGENVKLLHTSLLSLEHFEHRNLSRMRFAPVFLQEFIPKQFDLRIVVIGKSIYACEIHSQDFEDTKVDFRDVYRIGGIGKLRHIPHKVPDALCKQLFEFMHRCNLIFGVFDFAVTPDGEYVFFEVNTNGQWGWLEAEAGLDISSGMVREFKKYI